MASPSDDLQLVSLCVQHLGEECQSYLPSELKMKQLTGDSYQTNDLSAIQPKKRRQYRQSQQISFIHHEARLSYYLINGVKDESLEFVSTITDPSCQWDKMVLF